jgi:hypothetical protein
MIKSTASIPSTMKETRWRRRQKVKRDHGILPALFLKMEFRRTLRLPLLQNKAIIIIVTTNITAT